MPIFEQGRIVWAVIADDRGIAKPDPRPAMVITTVTVTGPDDLIPVIVGSTQFRTPPADDQVVIHDSYQSDPATKLRRPTALICSWLAEIRFADVQAQGGFLPGRRSFPIVQKALEIQRASQPPNES